jgi:hypothetical protein
MAGRELKLAIELPADLAAELEQLTKDTPARRRAVAVLERGKGQPNLTLEEAKKQLGLAE